MVHAHGIRGYFTRCKANAYSDYSETDLIGIHVKEGEEFTGTVTDELEIVDCPVCFKNIPKKNKT